jgi:hypothetical protein
VKYALELFYNVLGLIPDEKKKTSLLHAYKAAPETIRRESNLLYLFKQKSSMARYLCKGNIEVDAL